MEFRIIDAGLLDFRRAFQLQQEVLGLVESGEAPSSLILCRHYPVITLGRLGKESNIRISRTLLREKGIEVVRTNRGGDVTYHGPGQITAYPIFRLEGTLRDVHAFLRRLEDTVIDFLCRCGAKGGRRKGLTGVWVGNRKIASIGIAVKRWVSFHGVSVNVLKDDLANFSLIRPCGMEIEMTSLESQVSRKIDIETLKEQFASSFKTLF